VYQPELGSESVHLRTGPVLGNTAMPDGRMGKRVEETLLRGPCGCAKTASVMARSTGLTEAGFYIATEGRPRKRGQ